MTRLAAPCQRRMPRLDDRRLCLVADLLGINAEDFAAAFVGRGWRQPLDDAHAATRARVVLALRELHIGGVVLSFPEIAEITGAANPSVPMGQAMYARARGLLAWWEVAILRGGGRAFSTRARLVLGHGSSVGLRLVWLPIPGPLLGRAGLGLDLDDTRLGMVLRVLSIPRRDVAAAFTPYSFGGRRMDTASIRARLRVVAGLRELRWRGLGLRLTQIASILGVGLDTADARIRGACLAAGLTQSEITSLRSGGAPSHTPANPAGEHA